MYYFEWREHGDMSDMWLAADASTGLGLLMRARWKRKQNPSCYQFTTIFPPTCHLLTLSLPVLSLSHNLTHSHTLYASNLHACLSITADDVFVLSVIAAAQKLHATALHHRRNSSPIGWEVDGYRKYSLNCVRTLFRS
jgi:hypothetical protein